MIGWLNDFTNNETINKMLNVKMKFHVEKFATWNTFNALIGLVNYMANRKITASINIYRSNCISQIQFENRHTKCEYKDDFLVRCFD